jgi:hypothetical protein
MLHLNPKLLILPLPPAVDWNETERVSADEFLPESNKGFQLLLKLGWSTGTGGIACSRATQQRRFG